MNVLISVHTNNPALFVIVLFIAVVVAGVSYYFSKGQRIKRSLKAVSLKNIEHFVNGEYARITGRVYASGERIRAPFSGRECVYYYARVDEKTGKNSWSKVVDEEMMADVIICDGRHYAIIETDEPMTYLIPDREYTSEVFNDPTPQLEEFLKRHGVASEGLFGLNKTLRFQEGILEPGEQFTVAGYGEWKPAGGLPLDLPTSRVLFLKAGKEATVYISDDPETTVK